MKRKKREWLGWRGEGGIDAVVASYNSKHMNVQEHKRQRIIIIEETRIYWKDVRLEGKARDIWNGMRKKV